MSVYSCVEIPCPHCYSTEDDDHYKISDAGYEGDHVCKHCHKRFILHIHATIMYETKIPDDESPI
jgi:transposase-like protein